MKHLDIDKTIFLVDGNAYIHRAYHALPPLTTSKHLSINAVYGFTRMILKLIKNYNPKYLGICFDSSKPTFRHKMFPEYKATRKKIDEELKVQFPLVNEMVLSANISQLVLDGYEADDIISALANKFADSNYKIIIISADKDILQIVDKNIIVYNEPKDILFDEKKVVEKYGFKPSLLPDYFALLGDKIDNIPGVDGVGEKTAEKLIRQYGDLNNIYSEINTIEEKLRKRLILGKESAFKSKELVSLLKKINELDNYVISNLELNFNQDKLIKFLSKYEMQSIINELYKIKPQKILSKKETNQLDLNFSQIKYNPKFDLIIENISDQYLFLNSEKNFNIIKELLSKSYQEIFFSLIYSQSVDKLSHNNQNINNENQIFGLVGLIVKKKENDLKDNSTKEKIFFYLPLCNHKTFEDKIIEPTTKNSLIDFFHFLFSQKNLKFISYDLKHQLVLLKNKKLIKNICTDKIFDIKTASYLLNPTKNDYSLQTIVNDNLENDPILEFCFATDFDITTFPIEKLLLRLQNTLNILNSLYSELQIKLEKNGLIELLNKIELPLITVVSIIELEGIMVDREYILNLKNEIIQKLDEIQKSIFKISETKINLNSPKQLSFILFEKLKLPTIKKNKTGYSTNEEVLYTLRNAHPIIPLILENRELEKLKNTYLDPFLKLINSETNRIHTTFNLTGTSTGRLSSENPNLQNIPIRTDWGKKIRKMFVSQQGYKLVSFDYSQIELRILAHFSNDQNLITAFLNNEDVHTKTAMEIFNLSLKEVSNEHRRIAKVINFGIIYGMSAQGLAKELGINIQTAQDYINNYFNRYSSVKEWIKKTIESSTKTLSSRTLFNRYRPLNELSSPNPTLKNFGQRLAINTPIQGTAADIIKLAMIKTTEFLKNSFTENVSKMLLQIHDELLFEIRTDFIDKVVPEIKNIMESVVQLKIPLVVDVTISDRWEKK